MSNIGLAQKRSNNQKELPLVTCGNDVKNILQFLKSTEAISYSARDVVDYLLSLVAKKSTLAMR